MTRFGHALGPAKLSIHECSIILPRQLIDHGKSLKKALWSPTTNPPSHNSMSSSSSKSNFQMIKRATSCNKCALLLFDYSSNALQNEWFCVLIQSAFVSISLFGIICPLPSLHWFIKSVSNGWMIRWQHGWIQSCKSKSYFLFIHRSGFSVDCQLMLFFPPKNMNMKINGRFHQKIRSQMEAAPQPTQKFHAGEHSMDECSTVAL